MELISHEMEVFLPRGEPGKPPEEVLDLVVRTTGDGWSRTPRSATLPSLSGSQASSSAANNLSPLWNC